MSLMKNLPEAKKKFCISLTALLLFLLLTGVLYGVDRRSYEPLLTEYAEEESVPESQIGLAAVNLPVSAFLGFKKPFYRLTELLGYLEIALAAGIAAYAVYQFATRKSIRKMDVDVKAMMMIYALIVVLYVLFEKISPNFRPVVLEEGLEPSYPSTHTILGVAVMMTAEVFFARKFRGTKAGKVLPLLCKIISVSIVLCRLVSGVHWLTDILGGLLLAFCLAFLYEGIVEREKAAA